MIFDELDVFEEFVTALFRANTDRKQKAVNDRLWEFVISLGTLPGLLRCLALGLRL
jgi:hypothetical protein